MKTSWLRTVAQIAIASLLALSACQGQALSVFSAAPPAPEQRNDSGLVFRTY